MWSYFTLEFIPGIFLNSLIIFSGATTILDKEWSLSLLFTHVFHSQNLLTCFGHFSDLFLWIYPHCICLDAHFAFLLGRHYFFLLPFLSDRLIFLRPFLLCCSGALGSASCFLSNQIFSTWILLLSTLQTRTIILDLYYLAGPTKLLRPSLPWLVLAHVNSCLISTTWFISLEVSPSCLLLLR